MIENEVLDALVPENARFVSGQDIFLYVPKAQTDRRYGLVKYDPNDFSLTTDGTLKLLLPKNQIEDYLNEIRGGTRAETVNANPKINLYNLNKTDEDLYREVNDLHNYDSELHNEDIKLQKNIDYLIQDDRSSEHDDSTYSAKKITELIREAKMQGLHFVGYIGKELGIDDDGTPIVKEGALWYLHDNTDRPTIEDKWSEEYMYQCVDGQWVKSEDYYPSDFDIWKNVDLPDSEINTWWFFDNHFEVLDFNVDMSLYYNKSQSDHRFKSKFTYGDYLYESDGEINIDNLLMPTNSKLSIFDTTESNIKSTNVEDAIKELEDMHDLEIKLINDRPVLLRYEDIPTREGDYCVYQDGVYRSVETEEGYEWRLVTYDLDSLLPRSNSDRNIANGIEFYNDEESGYLLSKLSLVNLNTEEETYTPVSLPVATTVNDGIMPSTAMRAISELDIKIEALQSGVKSYFVNFDSDEPSQSMLDLLYKEVSNSTDDPPNLTRMIDASKNIYYEYYTVLDVKWQGPYIYRYSIASMDQAGLVMSSDEKGKVYVEPVSGVMSLNGYDDIINTFNTLYGGNNRDKIALSQVPELPASRITSGELSDDRLPIVPISKGGTGNSSFSANKLIVSDGSDNSKLKEGTAFGDANTILVGQGATQLPIFKSKKDAGVASLTDPQIQFAEEEYQKSKNLFNKDGVVLDTWLEAGEARPHTGFCTTNYIKIDGQPYTVSATSLTGGSTQAYYDADKNFIGESSLSTFIGTKTPPENAVYVRSNYKIEELNNNIQYEIGTQATDYQPYNGAIVHEEHLKDYLSLSGGEMSGPITLHTTGLITPEASGYSTDQYGNIKHLNNQETANFNIYSNDGSAKLKFYYETGLLKLFNTPTVNDVPVALSNQSVGKRDFTSMFRTDSKYVIPLVKLNGSADANNGAFLRVYGKRANGLIKQIDATISCQKRYNTQEPMYTVNKLTDSGYVYYACTFNYNSNHYFGLYIEHSAPLDTIHFDGYMTDWSLLDNIIRISSRDNATIYDEEVYNSLVLLDDNNYIRTPKDKEIIFAEEERQKSKNLLRIKESKVLTAGEGTITINAANQLLHQIGDFVNLGS